MLRVAEMRFQAMQHPDMVWYKPGSEEQHKIQIQNRLDNATHLIDHARLQMKAFPFLQPYRDSMPSPLCRPSVALTDYMRGWPVDRHGVNTLTPWLDEEERKCYVDEKISPRDKRQAEHRSQYEKVKASLEATGSAPTEEEISMWMDLAESYRQK